jgi:ubiquinone/menaquinone biosynthesis C-methylase UbiE
LRRLRRRDDSLSVRASPVIPAGGGRLSHQELDTVTQTSDWRSFYEDRYDKKRDRTVSRLGAFHRADNLALATRIRSYLAGNPHTVIDIGAGESITSAHIGAHHVVKADLASSALTSTGSHVQLLTERVCGDAVALPFVDCAFDAVVATQILEHIPDYRRALRECARVTKPGGLLVLTVPNSYRYMHRRYHRISRNIDKAGHLRAFDPTLLKREVEEYFDVTNARTTGFRIFAALMCFERVDKLQRVTRVLDRATRHQEFAVLGAFLLRIENRAHRQSVKGMSHEVYGIKR